MGRPWFFFFFGQLVIFFIFFRSARDARKIFLKLVAQSCQKCKTGTKLTTFYQSYICPFCVFQKGKKDFLFLNWMIFMSHTYWYDIYLKISSCIKKQCKREISSGKELSLPSGNLNFFLPSGCLNMWLLYRE